MGLIHPDKYTRARRPGIGDWTIVGDQVIIGIEPLGARRIRDEIPNWILNRPASISGRIVLKEGTAGHLPGTDHAAAALVPLVLNRRQWKGLRVGGMCYRPSAHSFAAHDNMHWQRKLQSGGCGPCSGPQWQPAIGTLAHPL